MTTPKEREVIFEIIEKYKDMPILWDRDHEDYKCKRKRNDANKILLEVYKKLYDDATTQTLVKKMSNLRTNYLKELRKVKDSEADNGEKYEPTLWYFSAFSFLDDANICNTSECCHSQHMDPFKTEAVSTSSSDDEGSCQHSETHSSPSIKRRKFTNPIVYKNNNSLELAVEPSQMNNEEWEIFGKAIALQLRDLDKKQLTIAQKIISDAIYYAKFGLLSQDTYIHVGNPPP